MLRLPFITLALAVFLLLASGSAVAHASKTTEDGKYRVTWGFLDEPGFTHQKNRLDLIIRDNATGAGVGGLTNLSVTLHYGDDVYDLGNVSAYRGAKGANAGDGNYTSANPVFLTKAGIYVLRVKGDIRGTPVNMDIPSQHEYEDMKEIMFPEEIEFGSDAGEARIAALEAEVAVLKAKAQAQSQTPATLTSQPPGDSNPIPAVGLLGLVAVLGFLALRRRA